MCREKASWRWVDFGFGGFGGACRIAAPAEESRIEGGPFGNRRPLKCACEGIGSGVDAWESGGSLRSDRSRRCGRSGQTEDVQLFYAPWRGEVRRRAGIVYLKSLGPGKVEAVGRSMDCPTFPAGTGRVARSRQAAEFFDVAPMRRLFYAQETSRKPRLRFR